MHGRTHVGTSLGTVLVGGVQLLLLWLDVLGHSERFYKTSVINSEEMNETDMIGWKTKKNTQLNQSFKYASYIAPTTANPYFSGSWVDGCC